MSARELLVAAVAAKLAPLPLTVFDAGPVRGGLPHAVVQEPDLSDWSGTGWTGREGRIAVTLADGGERPLRLRALLAQAEEAVGQVGPALGRGWRVASIRLVRSRLVAADRQWRATAEFAVRLYRENA